MEAPNAKPTVVIPDTAPLIHLAAADALTVLNGIDRVVVPDIVLLEPTFNPDKPYAKEVAAWAEAGQLPGSNAAVEVAETEIGGLYRIALEPGLRRPRNAGRSASRPGWPTTCPISAVRRWWFTRMAACPACSTVKVSPLSWPWPRRKICCAWLRNKESSKTLRRYGHVSLRSYPRRTPLPLSPSSIRYESHERLHAPRDPPLCRWRDLRDGGRY